MDVEHIEIGNFLHILSVAIDFIVSAFNNLHLRLLGRDLNFADIFAIAIAIEVISYIINNKIDDDEFYEDDD